MRGSFLLAFEVLAMLAGAFALLARPSAEWIESAYANGFYPGWQHLASAITLPLPFSLGDVAVLAAILALGWLLVGSFRRPRLLLVAGALLGVVVFWFEASWGWNYNRAPIESRVAYVAANANDAAVDKLRALAMARMNALAAPAHANESYDRDALRGSWLPVVRRLGDTWDPNVGRYKRSIFDPFMTATGTSGFINPLTLESQLASDLLWFEEPFDLSHEWSHVAAYAREDEANYIALVTCIRSKDPTIAYSGWMELFLYLPPLPKYDRKAFSPLVWADFGAIRARNAKHLNLSLSRFTWRTYGAYLKSNHIAGGIENYNEITRLFLAVPLDRDGLPVLR
jgi:hypothetical protein